MGSIFGYLNSWKLNSTLSGWATSSTMIATMEELGLIAQKILPNVLINPLPPAKMEIITFKVFYILEKLCISWRNCVFSIWRFLRSHVTVVNQASCLVIYLPVNVLKTSKKQSTRISKDWSKFRKGAKGKKWCNKWKSPVSAILT